jgi:hypothetical protein
MGAERARLALMLDASALVAIEQLDRRALALLEEVGRAPGQVAIPSGALSQGWRDGERQVRLARLVRATETVIQPLDEGQAQAVGIPLGQSGSTDVVDAQVVLCARRAGGRVATTNPIALQTLDSGLVIIPL